MNPSNTWDILPPETQMQEAPQKDMLNLTNISWEEK